MFKKIMIVLLVLIILLLMMGIIFYTIDRNRASKNMTPLFCIEETRIKDGGTVIYKGLGYKVIDFNTIEGFDDIKIGGWNMSYDDFRAEMNNYNKRY